MDPIKLVERNRLTPEGVELHTHLVEVCKDEGRLARASGALRGYYANVIEGGIMLPEQWFRDNERQAAVMYGAMKHIQESAADESDKGNESLKEEVERLRAEKAAWLKEQNADGDDEDEGGEGD